MLGGNAEHLAKSELRKLGYSDEIISEATGFADTSDPDILKAREEYAEFYNTFKAEIAPEAERVREAGGLFIIGTERHESRRIDNQLRGRSGRQGDPGASRFYISLEDDLMRLFGGERVYNMMSALNVDENMPIETGIISRSIESAQERIESRNFAIRKSVLDYDDVMNKQRELIYGQRNRVLDGEDIKQTVHKMITDTISSAIDTYLPGDIADDWDLEGLRNYFLGWLTTDKSFRYSVQELNKIDKSDIEAELCETVDKLYEEKEREYGEQVMREVERVMLLRSVDTHWMDHIDAMDELRRGIGLRAYGQHDPVIAYRNEGYDMFNAMTESIREDTSKAVLCVRIKKNEEQIERKKVAEEETQPTNITVRGKGVVSKNAPCPCGSGLKYKRCCGKDVD